MTTTPCVSLTTGTLSPDERVNYTFGMVLGVDDFQQEQTYGLFKDHLHHRALHGYGTVSGLAVSVTPVDNDYQVSVSTGIGVDQWGREFAITCEQCARLGSWLAAQQSAGHGLTEHPPGPSGELTVYVVASYQQCLTDDVPIPGSPCSTGPSTAPSRIRDVWDVELSWTPPPMPRWDSDRRLARLLDRVTVVDGLDPSLSDEAKITAAVRDLATLATGDGTDLDPPPVGSPPEPPSWKLPADQASAALDRILTVWVTQVRPGLAQDLYAPDTVQPAPDVVPVPAAILLSTITFTPAANFDVNAPVISWCGDPDDEGRPYLLHSQLIQELAERAGGAGVSQEVPATELVTLSGTADENAVVDIDAWFHLPEGVLLPPTLTVVDEDGYPMDYQTSGSNGAGTASDRWRLTSAPNGTSGISDGLQFSVLFPADTVRVGDPNTTLRDYVATTGINLLDQDAAGDVTAYGAIRMQPQPAPVPPPQPFVTVTPLGSNSDMTIFEFWFHLEPAGVRDDTTVGKFSAEVFDDWASNTGQDPALRPTWSPSQSGWPNAWLLRVIPGPTVKGNAQYLRVVFPAAGFTITTPDGELTLHDWIAKTGVNYQGWDQAADQLVVFARSPISQTATQLRAVATRIDAAAGGGGGQ